MLRNFKFQTIITVKMNQKCLKLIKNDMFQTLLTREDSEFSLYFSII